MAVAALVAGGCGDPGPARAPDEACGCAQAAAVRLGDAWEVPRLLAVDDAQAPRFVDLADGMVVAGAAPRTFRWQRSEVDPGAERGNVACDGDGACGPPIAAASAPAGDYFDLLFSSE